MIKKFLGIAVLALVSTVSVMAQQDTAKLPEGYVAVTPKTPSNDSFLLLVEKQKNIQMQYKIDSDNLKTQYDTAQTNLKNTAQSKLDKISPALQYQIEATKKANGWGDDVGFDAFTGLYYKKAETQKTDSKPEAPKSEAPKPEAPKVEPSTKK